MLKVLEEFRNRMDAIMHQCMDKRIVLYGYGYSGKFVGWYAEYYHSIKPDYIITQDMTSNIPYEFELYRESLFEFGYKDVRDAVVWICVPETEEIRERLETHGYVKNRTYFDFCEAVYEGTGIRGNDVNVQFLRWLEEKYGCDLVRVISADEFSQEMEGTHGFVGTTQKEVFPLLDKCHISYDDAIFDFGCGKGGAMLSFLDYGFQKVGGIEFQKNIYEIMIQNFKKLHLEDEMKAGKINCICGDASKLGNELDEYNWFYFFDPFEGILFEQTIARICESLERNPRKGQIIYINPRCHKAIEDTGKFNLTNRFTILTRQRVVHVYVSKNCSEE